VLWAAGVVNVILAAFNLIPLPPLDGSALVERLIPASMWEGWARLRQYSMGILIILLLAVPGALDHVFGPAIRLWERLL
jgi:Zn-dependent protease